MDTGRQSGGGRVDATFFDLCSQIWSGSPATKLMSSGLESEKGIADDDPKIALVIIKALLQFMNTPQLISKETVANYYKMAANF